MRKAREWETSDGDPLSPGNDTCPGRLGEILHVSAG